jgi:hypothetical protein
MTHHIISRIIDREWLIDDAARERYLELLGRALKESDWRCLSYSLMSNHFHLGTVAGESSLASWIRRVHTPFANWLNERRGRIGPVFAERPKAWVIRREHEPDLIAYIHNNPSRAGLGPARDNDWTSHRAYLGLTRPPAWLALREGMKRARCATTEEFDALVTGKASLARNDPALGDFYREARRRGAVELATPIHEPVEVPIVARIYAHVRPDPRDLVWAVADAAGVPYPEVCAGSRRRTITPARKVAVHLGALFGVSRTAMATALGVSPQAGSRYALTPLDEQEGELLSEAVRRLDLGHSASCQSG